MIHIFGFFGVIVTMWVLSPTGDPKTVFVCIPVRPKVGRDARVLLGSLVVRQSTGNSRRLTEVQTTFSDGGGWGSLGGAALVGISSGILPLVGADAAVHMSEEVKDAGRALPR